MTRIFGHSIASEMILLWLIDAILCFVIIYSFLWADVVPAIEGVGTQLQLANYAAILALTTGLTSFAIGLYRPETCLEIRRIVVNTAVGGVVALAAIWCMGETFADRHILSEDSLLPLKISLAWAVSLSASHFLFSCAVRMNLLVRRVVIIGGEAEAVRTADAVRSLRPGIYAVSSVVRFEDGSGVPEAAVAAAVGRADRACDVIVTSDVAPTAFASLQRSRGETGGRVYRDVDFWERHLRRIDALRLDAASIARLERRETSVPSSLIRRVMDVTLSATMLLLTLPLMAFIAIAIKLDSPGPVLYRQERVGLFGRRYTLCKFRSMRVDAERRGPVWASPNDARVTSVGAFIRKARIDELPQLLNVMRGEMSLVGPRPERPHFVATLAEAIPHYACRSLVKPGVTGWAQVNYPYGASIEDARMKLSYDLYYVKHRSLLLDILILFSTVRVVLFQEGAR